MGREGEPCSVLFGEGDSVRLDHLVGENQLCVELEGNIQMGCSNFVLQYKRKLSLGEVKVTC